MQILKPYRAKIDRIDDAIVDLLKERFAIVDEVAVIKARENIPVVIEERVREVIDRAGVRAGPYAPEVREVYTALVGITCDHEEKLVAKHSEIV